MIRGVLDRLYLFAGFAAGGFMILIFVLMTVLSAGRPLGVNVPAGDDLVAWSMVAMSFLGLAHTFKSGDMIRVGLLTERLTPGLGGYLVLIVSGLFVPVIAVIGYLGIALYYIIPFRRLSAGILPRRWRKKQHQR